MDTLKQLLNVYRQANKIKFKEPKQMSNQTLQFGDILEIYVEGQLLIATAISDSEACLMSEFTEFATHTDFIVYHVDHLIADKWIIETDKRLYLTGEEIYRITSRLNETDISILKDIIVESKPAPTEKSGPKLPPNPKDPRYKFKQEELKKTLLINKHLFYEEEEKEEGT